MNKPPKAEPAPTMQEVLAAIRKTFAVEGDEAANPADVAEQPPEQSKQQPQS
jgi:hypothetical protein